MLAAPSPASAGGFTIPAIGTRGSTVGGFVARPDDTSAMYHNPAGLALLGRHQADIAGTAILSHTNYSRCTSAYDAQGNPIPGGCLTDKSGILYEKEITTVPHGGFPAGFGILPFLGLSSRFGLEDWNFGLAVYSPHNATGAFPDCTRDASGKPLDCSGAPHRFHSMLGTINTIYIAPAVAYTPHPDIHIGVGVQVVRAALTSERSLWIGGPKSMVGSSDDWKGEGIMKLDASAWSASFNLGVIWHMGRTLEPGNRWLRGLKLGVSFSSMTWFTLKSDMKLHSPLLYNMMLSKSGCTKGDANTHEISCPVTIEFTFPLMIRPGFHWQITDEWGLGLEFYWQNYSVYDELRVKFEQPMYLISDSIKLEEVVEPKNSTDCTTISAGVQYAPRWARGLEIRLGFMWDQSPYPDSTYSLLSPDANKMGPSIGLGYAFDFGLEINVGYLPLFYKDRIVRNSMLRPKICPADNAICKGMAPDADFSMNGDVVNKRVDLFMLQIGWSVGEKKAL